MKKRFILIILVFFSTNSFGTAVWHGSTIKSIYPLADDSFILRLDVDSSSCQSAESPKYYYVKVGEQGVTQGALNRMYSAALAAGVAKKNVQIAYEDNSSSCFINRLLVDF